MQPLVKDIGTSAYPQDGLLWRSRCIHVFIIRPMLNIDKSMERSEKELHIQSVFAGSEELIPLANPKIYVRSKWTPPTWDISLALERCLRTFRKALEPKFRFPPV